MSKVFSWPILLGTVVVTGLLAAFAFFRMDPIVAQAAGPMVSPPVIPHTLVNREGNCLLCHRDIGTGYGVPQTTHPERPNCLQCHVPKDVNS
ncbi:hypothetical protein [Desulfitobacterium sp. Sab5]|uniref:hypothetical protein n=1 Tax=Desulfitobacterium TaxID=36853 RepID=UPI003CE7A058